MNILGISAFYHDSAACIIRDGRVIAAAQEERFSRIKHDSSFPRHAIAYCLQEAGCSSSDLDMVAFHEKPILKFDRALETFLYRAPRNGQMFWRGMGSWFSEKLRVPDLLEKDLGFKGEVCFASHHESHAASAFYLSPFESSAVLTIDGVGEWSTNTLSTGDGSRLDLLRELSFPHSLGLLYSAFTHYLGFRVNWGEYKVMGLAPYGRPRFVDTILEELIDVKPDGSFRLHMDKFSYLDSPMMTDCRFEEVFQQPRRIPESDLTLFHMDVARSLQEVTTKILVSQARFARELTDSGNLAMAGGVALNCVANGAIERERLFDSIWIQPAANDAGGALGAALVAWHKVKEAPRVTDSGKDGMSGSYLGPQFSDDEIEKTLQQRKIEGVRLDSPALLEQVADRLANGEVVGWFQGRMEFGPRALGNRSILADPRGDDVQRRVNEKIKFREGFRPFAPAVLSDRREEWFQLGQESPYMLFVAPVADSVRISNEGDISDTEGLDRLHEKRSKIQAVTHVDFSARVQTVDGEANPLFHQLLQEFESRTGTPVLLNTSFNLRGEPVCCSPNDALSSFLASGMDVLVMGSFMVTRPPDAVPTGKVSLPPVAPPVAPSVKQRGFAALTSGLLLTWLVFQGQWDWVSVSLLGLSGVLCSSAIVMPSLFAVIHRGIERWVRTGLAVLSRVLFAMVFYLIMTPIGLLKNWFSSSSLDRSPSSELSSYWEARDWSKDYDRMF